MVIKTYLQLNKFVKENLIAIIKNKLLKDKKLIIVFKGNLGSGKTTLIKKIAKELKIKETLTSPTFILWQIYHFKLTSEKFNFHHIDLYRIKAKDLLKLSLKDKLGEKNNLFLIEWGEKLINFLKKRKLKYLLIEIKILSKTQREINLKWKN